MLEGTVVDPMDTSVDSRGDSPHEQYQYLQQQQLSQQALQQQIQRENVTPIGIPGGSGSGSGGPVSYGSIQGHSLSLSQVQRLNESFNRQSSISSATSSFFSPSSASRYVPHTNEPSSVSSSYKSAVPPSFNSAYSSFNAPPTNTRTDRYGQSASSFSRAAGVFPLRTNSIGGGHSFSFGVTPPPGGCAAFNGQEPDFHRDASEKTTIPPIRTSLLTSKLAAANVSSSSCAGSVPGSATIPPPNAGSYSYRYHWPPSIGSGGASPYSSDPQNYSTSARNSGTSNSTLRQNFLPHPSHPTTNITKTQVSATPSSNESSAGSAREYEGSFKTSMGGPADTERWPDTSSGPDQRVIGRLQHQSHAHDTFSVYNAQGARNETTPSGHLDIANHPVPDVLVMLTALLQKIVDSNDAMHLHYNQADDNNSEDLENNFASNVLAFHGRNIPAITLHAYLPRILKYCPTTNEVFISLLIYFDRIAQRANAGRVDDGEGNSSNNNGHQLFVIDSYNIHRLIIAGVTVASKFFSDVFYKNSRYAKVGGLPVDELNHLELQFLLLMDFKLMISLEELQRYADLLLRFWQKEALDGI